MSDYRIALFKAGTNLRNSYYDENLKTLYDKISRGAYLCQNLDSPLTKSSNGIIVKNIADDARVVIVGTLNSLSSISPYTECNYIKGIESI